MINNPAKGFVKEVGARFWGLELDGEKGLLRSSTLRMWPLAFITMRVASLGLASVGLLEAIAGSWVSILGIRRRLYSVMDIIFEPLRIADRKIVLRLSPELVSELEALVVVGSLAVVNLRADFYCQIVATDASGDCMAGVAAECPERVLREVSRHCLRKGTWTKLLPPSIARDRLHGILDPSDEVPGDKLKGHPLWNLKHCLLVQFGVRGCPNLCTSMCWNCVPT